MVLIFSTPWCCASWSNSEINPFRSSTTSRGERRVQRSVKLTMSANRTVASEQASAMTPSPRLRRSAMLAGRMFSSSRSVLVQREMESGRNPLVSRFRPSGGDFQGMRVYRSDVVWGEREKEYSAPPSIVSMSPPGYPSAWVRPRRARFCFTRQNHCKPSLESWPWVCWRRSCLFSRACSSLLSRAAWICFWRPASISMGVT